MADSAGTKLPSKISVRPADWHADRDILRALREEVFVREQSVPDDMEWDEFDAQSRHVVAIMDNIPIGAGRLLPDGHIGRMAVLRAWRGKGAGSALLTVLMEIARDLGMHRVRLNAQVHALPFYLSHGFQAEGEEFLDAGIPHRRMWRDL
jgi:predicted GNAT family N-acyltransferase